MNRFKRLLSVATVALGLACGGDELLEPTSTMTQAGSAGNSIGVGSSGETIATDEDDYAPGQTVTMTGTGWEPGETVRLHLDEVPQIHEPRQWDVQADSAGSFTDASFAPEPDDVGVTFTLTATGLSSGRNAQTIFTDASRFWHGCANNNNWHDTGNWRESSSSNACTANPSVSVPITDDPVTILNVAPAGRPFPVINSAASAQTLTVNAGAQLTINANLTLANDVTVNGTWTHTAGNVAFNTSGKKITIAGAGSYNQSGGTFGTLNANRPDFFLTGSTSTGTQSGGTLNLNNFEVASGRTFNQSGSSLIALVKDYKVLGTFNSTGGKVQFATISGSSAVWQSTGANNFFDVEFDVPVTLNSQTISVRGNWINDATGNLAGGNTHTVVFTGAGDQNIGGTNNTTFRAVTVNKSGGALELGRNQTVTTNLTLTLGNVTTNSHVLIISSGGAVVRTSGHVVGNLQRTIASGNAAAVTYDIGTAAAYTPLVIDVDGSGGTAGGLIGTTSGDQHPNIGTSGLSPSVARFWNLTSTGVTGTAAVLNTTRTYKLRLQFLDHEAGNPNDASVIRRWDGSTWNAPAGTYTRGANFTENLSFNAFSDFVVGTLAPVQAATSLSVAAATGTFGGTTNLSATLTSGGNPVQGKTISFTLNGNGAGNATTNASGVASLADVSLSGINAGSYPTGVAASFAADAGHAGSVGSNSLTVDKAAGSVSINNIPSTAVAGGSFVAAYTHAGVGTPSVASLSGSICSTSGNTVNFLTAGTCQLQASITEGTNHEAATGAVQSFTIGTAGSSLSIEEASGTFGGTANLSATLTSGGNPVQGKTISFTLNGSAAGTAITNSSGVASVSNANLSGINAGMYPTGVAASFDGNGTHGPSSGSNKLTVAKAAGSITINNIPSNAVVGGSFVPGYTQAGTGTASVASLTGAICSVSGNDVNFDAVGTCTLQASVTQGTNHEAATGAEQSFDIDPASTALSVAAASGSFGGTTTLSATLTSGGNPVQGQSVSFTIDGNAAGSATTGALGVASLANVSLSGFDAGMYPLGASFATSGNYDGSSGSNTLTVNKAAGLVSISNLPSSGLVGGSFSPTYSTSGDGTPSVTSLTSGVCSVSGNAVNFVGTGTCRLQASVTEGTNHLSATGVQQTFIVGYAFGGLLPPVDRPNTYNVSKAGQTVPLKWRLLGAGDQPILELASVTIKVSPANCASSTSTDTIEEYASGQTGLQNHGDGYYQFNWKTPANYASSCRTISLDFGDSYVESAVAFFTFKK